MNLNDYASADQVMGFVRHLLTSIGGATVVTSHMTADDWQFWVGLVTTAVGFIWSHSSKTVAKEVTQ